MGSQVNRRRFLEVSGSLAVGLGFAGPLFARAGTKLADGAPHAEKLGWHLGCQAYSFNRFTFFEAVEKNASLGLRYIEAYPGQKMSIEKPAVKIGPGMSKADRQEVKKCLADAGTKLVNFGVCSLSKDEAVSRKTFDFAAEMGIQTLVSEPAFDAFDTLEKLTDEYAINIAIHNHPKPSKYWNPDTVLKVCEGRTKRIGACADTGHWVRSGLNPIEQIKKLQGRIISFHFKDLNQYGRSAHDVPWGTGVNDVKATLTEIQRQEVKGVFSIEYEYHWTNSLPEIAKCVAYFDKVAAELGS